MIMTLSIDWALRDNGMNLLNGKHLLQPVHPSAPKTVVNITYS